MTIVIEKPWENTNTKTKTLIKTTTKTKTQAKYLKQPTYVIFLKSWWLTHSKYDDMSTWLPCFGPPISSTGTSVSSFRDFFCGLEKEEFMKLKNIEKVLSSLIVFGFRVHHEVHTRTLFWPSPLVFGAETRKNLNLTNSLTSRHTEADVLHFCNDL